MEPLGLEFDACLADLVEVRESLYIYIYKYKQRQQEEWLEVIASSSSLMQVLLTPD